MVTTSYPINVTLYETDGTTVSTSKLVTVRDETTSEIITGQTDGSGQIILNLGNLASGYTDADVITIFSVDGSNSVSEQFTADTSSSTYTTTLTYIDVSTSGSATLRYFTAGDFREFFCLAAYNATTAPNGIKTSQIENIGEGIEMEIDRLLGQKFDDNDGSYYTATDEYHDANARDYTKDIFSDWAPINSVTKFEVNGEVEGDTPDWTDLVVDTTQETDWSYEATTGRFRIEDSTYFPPRGARQIRLTYTYGLSSVPKDIKRLAILMTGRSLGGSNLIANAISGTEMEGSGGSITILDSSYIQREINMILGERTRINARNL